MTEETKAAAAASEAADKNTEDAKPKADPSSSKAPAAPKHEPEPYREGIAVSGGKTDSVSLAAIGSGARKSLSIHHLQRRLAERGYGDALADTDGRYGALTTHAVEEYQTDNGLEVTGVIDNDTLHAIFDGDPHVVVTA